MHQERRPFPVSLQLRERTFDEEPLKSSKGTGEGLAVDQLQGFARERRRFARGGASGSLDERVEVLDVTREPVRCVETQRGDGVQPTTGLVGSQAPSNRAGGVGERPR
jgi:hypothetical protein